MLIDSHCHLNLLELKSDTENIDTVVARAHQNDVEYSLNVSVSIKDFPEVLSTAEKYADVGASVGLHPNAQEEEVDAETLVKLGTHPKVIAIGETGLDYFRSTGDVEWQRTRFRAHIQAAKQLSKPIIVHTRAAKEDTLKILKEEDALDVSGIMHCFTEDWETAKKCLDLGFYISFSGIVTFKNATIIQEVAHKVPLERMLIETDSPYLAPIPERGKPNEPSYIKYTAEFLANLRGLNYADFAAMTNENFYRLFKGVKK